jgi:alkanesulfonate monooxygenase SsuD/methylene tetrahydromethanopterin reductase-like flavin-dependent oxidoreductase (luciferase family)
VHARPPVADNVDPDPLTADPARRRDPVTADPDPLTADPARRRDPVTADPARRPGPLGFILPTLPQDRATVVSAHSLAAVAGAAEAAGASALWACDHVFWHGPVVECMTALTVAATATQSAMVGAGVLQLPLRDPVLAAKQAASVELLSEGRLLLGLGVGSHPGEYEAAGADYHRRGRQLDADIAVLRSLWRHGTVDPNRQSPPAAGDRGFDAVTPGPYHQLPAGIDIPIWFGGSSEAAIARCADVGDGWIPLFVSPEDYGPTWRRLRQRCEDGGRDPQTVTPGMVVFVSIGPGDTDDPVDRGTRWMSSLYRVPARAFARHLVSGSARRCARSLLRWFEAGAAHVTVFVTVDDPLVQFEDLAAELHHLLGTSHRSDPVGALVPQ